MRKNLQSHPPKHRAPWTAMNTSRNLRDIPPREAMDLLHGVVSDRFTHGDLATDSLFSNWLLWTLGFADSRFRDKACRVLSVREVAGSPDRVRRAYSVRGDPAFANTIVGIYGNIASHRYIAYPQRSIVGARGQRPGRVEQAAGVARFAVPPALLVAGAFLIRSGKRRGCGTAR